MENQILIAKTDFVDIDLRTLVSKNEFVKCVFFEQPVIGSIYTLDVQHFGTDRTSRLRLDLNGLQQFEKARLPIIDDAYF